MGNTYKIAVLAGDGIGRALANACASYTQIPGSRVCARQQTAGYHRPACPNAQAPGPGAGDPAMPRAALFRLACLVVLASAAVLVSYSDNHPLTVEDGRAEPR